MFIKLVNAEHSKIFNRRIWWIEIAVLALLVAGLYTIGYLILLGETGGELTPEAIEGSLTWPAGLNGALSFAAGPNLGGLLMIILVGAVVAQEYTWGTLQLWLSRGIPRPLFLSAKFTALLLPAFLLVLTALLAGGLLSAIFSLNSLGRIPFEQVDWARLGLDTLIFTYSLLPYAALTFFIAIATRSTVAAVGGGLAYALLFEGIVLQLIGTLGGIWGRIGVYLPGGLTRGLLSLNSGINVQVGGAALERPQFLEPGLAALGIALYIVFFVVVSILIFRRQDLNI